MGKGARAKGTTEIHGKQIQTVNARDLHSFLESRKQFSNWIKDRIGKYGFVQGQDYVVISGSPVLGNGLYNPKPRIDYHLSLDMAKELSMVERNEKGKQAFVQIKFGFVSRV